MSTAPQETSITGRFAGQSQSDAGCAWIEPSGAQRIEVAYPNGWHIKFEPLALYDQGGRQRAKGGDTLVVEGYFQQVGGSVCDHQRMFVATDVVALP